MSDSTPAPERRYRVILFDDRTRTKTHMTDGNCTHKEACTILRKCPNRPGYPHLRYMVEAVQ